MSSAVPARVQEIKERLERMILSGQLQPGDRLNELSLSVDLAVSRAHLREAMRVLEEARLVQIEPNRGARVRKLDLSEALELFDVRAGLARSMGRLAVLRATRSRIKEIQSIHKRMGSAASAADIRLFHDLNLQFHALLLDMAANRRLSELDTSVRNEMQLYIRSNVSSEAQLRLSYEEHGTILTALVAGDEDACGAAFERHILNGKRRLMDGAQLVI